MAAKDWLDSDEPILIDKAGRLTYQGKDVGSIDPEQFRRTTERIADYLEPLVRDLADVERIIGKHVTLDDRSRKKLRHQLLAFLAESEKPRGKRGAPRKHESLEAFRIWTEMGKPSLTRADLARKYFGPEYTAANGVERRRMRDRLRHRVERLLGL